MTLGLATQPTSMASPSFHSLTASLSSRKKCDLKSELPCISWTLLCCPLSMPLQQVMGLDRLVGLSTHLSSITLSLFRIFSHLSICFNFLPKVSAAHFADKGAGTMHSVVSLTPYWMIPDPFPQTHIALPSNPSPTMTAHNAMPSSPAFYS